MPKSLTPLTWFRAFDAAARHLSFTAAADELGFTQSAISQHVRALEQRLGAPLFIRGKRALILTEAGRGLVPDVAAAMAQLARATERFVPSPEVPKLPIATSASVSQWVMAPGLRHFLAAHPGSALQLVSTIWPDDFSATRADIDIRFGADAVVGRNATLIEPSQLCAVVAKADDKWGEVPCAFIELKDGAEADEAGIITFAREHLAGFKTPKRVVFAELPKTSTGKIQKIELRKVAQAL